MNKIRYNPNLKLRFSKYPKRTLKDNRLADSDPYGDVDKDRVMNYFDCKPLNRWMQDVTLYHGTHKKAAAKIRREGLKKTHSITGHIFLTSSKEIARRYAGGTIGGGTVFQVRVPDELVEESTGGPKHPAATTQVMIKKNIPPSRIKEIE